MLIETKLRLLVYLLFAFLVQVSISLTIAPVYLQL